MLREISEQDETILRALNQDEQTIFGICEKIRSAGGTFFVGCGSSYHACLAGSYMFSKLAKVHVNVALASEFENYEHFLTDRSLIFAVSQSGETADVLDAVTAAKRRGSRVVSIVNREGSILARESDYQLFMNSGPEICVLSTKTYLLVTKKEYIPHWARCSVYNGFGGCIKDKRSLVYPCGGICGWRDQARNVGAHRGWYPLHRFRIK